MPHTGDQAPLDQCREYHRYQKNAVSKAKFAIKLTFFARRFYTLYKQKFSNLGQLLSITFLKGFRKSKNFGHWSLESGGKKTLK